MWHPVGSHEGAGAYRSMFAGRDMHWLQWWQQAERHTPQPPPPLPPLPLLLVVFDPTAAIGKESCAINYS